MAGYIGSKSSVTLVDGYTEAETDALIAGADSTPSIDDNGNATAITIDSNENVGIGTSSSNPESSVFTPYLTVKGGSYDGVMQVVGSRADGDGAGVGQLNFLQDANTTNKTIAQVSAETDGATANNRGGNLLFSTKADNGSNTEAMRIDSSGNVGIGTISPSEKLHIDTGVNSFPATSGSTQTGAALRLRGADNAVLDMGLNSVKTWIQATDRAGLHNNYSLCLNPNGGDVLVGHTGTADSVVDNGGQGVSIRGTENDVLIGSTSTCLYLNREDSDGTILNFRKDGTTVGNIGRGGSGFFIAGVASSDFGVVFDGSGLISSTGSGVIRDNQYDMGHGGFRWNDIYATNGTIQTSDFNEKQDIASLTATEMLVGKRISALFKTFRWKKAVVEKGDNARTHTGVIAQDVQAAFTAEGLDAGDYALFTSFTWWEQEVDVPAVEAVAEVTDEDGNVTTKAVEAVDAYTSIEKYDTEAEAPEGATSKTRMGIRYPELLSFVAAYNEQRFASIEARLTALEDV